jgi:hypothetical protein
MVGRIGLRPMDFQGMAEQLNGVLECGGAGSSRLKVLS